MSKTAHASIEQKRLLLWLAKHSLTTMDEIKDSPTREQFCFDFNNEYLRWKARYKELTGKEWEVVADSE